MALTVFLMMSLKYPEKTDLSTFTRRIRHTQSMPTEMARTTNAVIASDQPIRLKSASPEKQLVHVGDLEIPHNATEGMILDLELKYRHTSIRKMPKILR